MNDIPNTDEMDRTQFHARLTDQNTSAFAKYCDTAVGRRGIISLIRYEVAFGLASPWPGAFGYLVRKKLLPGMLGRAGGGILFGRDIAFRHPHRIAVGEGSILDDHCVLDAKGDSETGIDLGSGVMIGRATSLSCKGGTIEVGDNTNISGNCMLISESSLVLGRNVLIAGMCYLIAGGNHSFERTDIPVVRQPMAHRGGIAVDDNCWLGAGVTVLDGVTIGRDSIIGAGSVVTKSIPEFAIAAGVPAKILKMRK